MQNLKQQGNIGGTRRPKNPKPLFIGAKAFMKTATRINAFSIYALPSPNVEPCPHEIPSQYQKLKDMFVKKNVDTLPKH